MKDVAEVIGISILVVGVVFGVLFGFASLVNYANERDKKSSDEACKQVSELAGSKEYKVDSSYNCVFVKDGKLQTVKDW